MRRSIFITLGIVVILFVIGLWVYLMLYGTPENRTDVFTNLGFEIEPQAVAPITPPEPETGYTVDTRDGLAQLTTRSVAGFTEIVAASSSRVRYVEQGTGHIYEINIDTGAEQLLSRTTIPRVQEAYFSPNGQAVAVVSVHQYIRDVYVGTIDEAETALVGTTIQPGADNVHLPNANAVQYTLSTGEGLVGYEYNLDNEAQRELFRTPFTQVIVYWGETNYAVTKLAEDLMGYVYELRDGSYIPTDFAGFGLLAKPLGPYMVVTEQTETALETNFNNPSTKDIQPVPLIMIPEKCTFIENVYQFICAHPVGNFSSIVDWYKGSVLSEDQLWTIDAPNNQATLLHNLSNEAQRPIDITGLQGNPPGTAVLFINRIDNTLWRQML